MKRTAARATWGLVVLAGAWGCAAPRILGKTTFVDDPSAGPKTVGAPAPGVTVNFINLGGAIDESVVSVQTDAKGQYRSPELVAGKYTVEAMFPGYVIGHSDVTLSKHGSKKASFALKKIREARGKSLQESETENIPTPGEVKIHPPN